jgi:hypothetical protein
MQYLGDSIIANAGHYGHDSFYGELDQYVMVHSFRVKLLRKTETTRIDVVRDFDESRSIWRNAYTLKLTSDGKPLAGKQLEFWYVERWKPGYDNDAAPLADRMKQGGEAIWVNTDSSGIAHVSIPRLDSAASIHHTVKLVVRFNADGSDGDYKPAQTPQLEFYSKQSY